MKGGNILLFLRVALVMGRRTLLGFCPTLMGFLFPVSPDPLTAMHCIRGSVFAGGDGDTVGSIFSILFMLLGFSFFLRFSWSPCSVQIILYIFLLSFVPFVARSVFSFFLYPVQLSHLSCLAIHPVLFVGELAERKLSEYPGDAVRTATTIFLPGVAARASTELRGLA